MLSALIRSSIRYPFVVVTLAILLLGFGAFTLTRAKYDVFPEFVPAQANIQTEAPGLTAEDVERLVTLPLENAINGGANIAQVRSQSIQGLSVIDITFNEGSDIFRDRQLLAERVAQASTTLPIGVSAPTLGPMTSSTMDLLKIGFVSDQLSPVELRSLIEWTVRPRLLAVPGVARAIIFGGGRREIRIAVKSERLTALHLALSDVTAAATAATGMRGADFIDTDNQRVLLRSEAIALTPQAIARTVITQQDGANISLGDVADVSYAPEPNFGEAHVQGRPDVLLSLGSQYQANTLEVTRDVEAALAEIMPMLRAKGVRVYPALHRPATFIEAALRNMRSSLLIGALFVVLVLSLFLRNWRTALISFVTIPLSLLFAVIAMNALGWTINTMTLGGLAVAVGLVVDDAIIDVENIVRRLRLASHSKQLNALDVVVLNASIEVRRPIVLATIVVMLVFVPILLLPGLQGSFFAPMALAFLLATLGSLLVALTVTPALCWLLLRNARLPEEPRWLQRVKLWQHSLLKRTMSKVLPVMALVLVLGAATVLIAAKFGRELLPEFREGHLVVQFFGPPGLSLNEMARVGDRVAQQALMIAGVSTVAQQIGRAEAGEDTWGPNRAEFHIELKPDLDAETQEQIQTKLREMLAEFPGFQSEVMTFLGDRISESISGETAPVAISVFGPDLDQLDETAAAIAAALRSMPDATDVRVDTGASLPTVSIRPRLERLAAFGLRPIEVLDTVQAAFAGTRVGQVYEGNEVISVRVVLANQRDPEKVGQLLVRSASGRDVPLSALADVDLVSARGAVSHEAGRRRQVITLNTTGSDVVGFVTRAQQVINSQVKLPTDFYYEVGGSAGEAKTATQRLLINSAAAFVGIVLLLVAVLHSPRGVALVLVNVPFALLGGVIALALTSASLSMGALVGFVALFGISARNAIMLISHYEELVLIEGKHWSRFTALRGARERLTPIVMTALVTALGLAPLAWGSGEPGREIEGPMAIVILGGLLSSMLLNLWVMPVLAARYLRFKTV